jgi:HsdR family type I site-specific deoxyribonuclease
MTESDLEQLALAWFQDAGWDYLHGPDIAPDSDTPERSDYRQAILPGQLRAALYRLNQAIPEAILDDVARQLAKPDHPSLILSNRAFHEALTTGVPVEVEIAGEKRGDRVQVIDFEHPERNRFVVVNQFTVQGSKQPRRPDLVCFINGLPVAVIELKNPANEQADIWAAFNQLQTYKDEIADLFVNNEALVISDGLNARIGSLTANRERFLPWRTLKSENDRPLLEFELEKVVRGFFAPELLLDYLSYFVLFETAEGQTVKKIAGYHQFHAVRAAVKAAVIAATQPAATLAQEQWATYADRVKPGSRMGGIVWHTQGSGKSISMVCFAAKLMQQKEMQNPTLVVVTDRNDLDGQLFQTFVGAKSLLKELPQQANDRDELRALLAGRPAGGIIFSTVQKFAPRADEERFPELTDRTNVVVIADEAHRSQYGFRAVLDKKTGNIQVRLRQASARRAEERHLRRLYRHAGGRRRQGHPRRVWRLRQHLRHPGRGGRRRHGADLLRKPAGQAGPQPSRDGTDERRCGGSLRGRGRCGAEGGGQDPMGGAGKAGGRAAAHRPGGGRHRAALRGAQRRGGRQGHDRGHEPRNLRAALRCHRRPAAGLAQCRPGAGGDQGGDDRIGRRPGAIATPHP